MVTSALIWCSAHLDVGLLRCPAITPSSALCGQWEFIVEAATTRRALPLQLQSCIQWDSWQ